LHQTWGFEDGEAILGVETAKEIAGKERGLDFFDSIRPAPALLGKGKKPLKALGA
jgi:hypothetical protein